MSPATGIPVRLVDDDPDDRVTTLEAIAESRPSSPVAVVNDGQELSPRRCATSVGTGSRLSSSRSSPETRRL